jgi:predicted aldo/keto reductase-like oxidoreductase
MNRRCFLRNSVVGTLAFYNFPHYLFASEKKKNATDRILLGPKKVEVSRLAQGSGTNGSGGSSNQTRKLGVNGLANLYKACFDDGITFWDTADQYGSHPHLCEALKSVPREKVAILTKTHASTEKEMRADLDRFRRELNTDYLDILLLHCMMDGNWDQQKAGAMHVIEEAQAKGIVRTKGTSCHTLEALKTAAASPWVEVDLARFNHEQLFMDAAPNTVHGVLKQMKASGKGVIGMKILGAGELRNRVDESLQFALAQDVLDCFTIGAESRAEMQDLVRRIPPASVRA